MYLNLYSILELNVTLTNWPRNQGNWKVFELLLLEHTYCIIVRTYCQNIL